MTQLLSVSGLFKTFECFAVFICLVIHRIGNNGSQVSPGPSAPPLTQCCKVFFGTSRFQMQYNHVPSETDAEILGCGILTCMCIVSLTILLSYLLEGREVVQSTVVDSVFCFLAAALLLTAGGESCTAHSRHLSRCFLYFLFLSQCTAAGMACFTYNKVFALSGPPTIPNQNISRSSMQVAAAMGVMCIGTGILYLADFFYVLCQRTALLADWKD